MTRASLLVLAALAAATILNAQWLDRTFWLSDTFPNLADNRLTFVNPATGRLYLGGDNGVQVFDCLTGRKHSAFDEYCEQAGFVSFPRAGKLFCASYRDVWAFDAAADTFLSAFCETDEYVTALAVDRRRGKLYAASDRYLVEVFSAWTGTRLAVMEVNDPVTDMAWDSSSNRIFCVHQDFYDILVVDCALDTIIGNIRGVRAQALALNPLRREVISAGYYGVTFSSTDSLVVLDSIRLPFALRDPRLFVDRNANRLYVTSDHSTPDARDKPLLARDSIAVIDLATNTLTALAGLRDSLQVYGAALNERDGRLYFRDYYTDSLFAVSPDGSVQGMARLAPDPWLGYGIAWHPSLNQIFAVTRDTLFGFDCSTGTMASRTGYYDFDRCWLSWSPVAGRLCIGNGDGLGWIGPGDSVEHWHPARDLALVAAAPAAGRLYFAGGNTLWVYDCAADSILAAAELGVRVTGPNLLLQEHSKLYLRRTDDSLGVYDIAADSLLAPIAVGAYVSQIAYNSRSRMVYAIASGGGTTNIVEMDPVSDSVTRRVEVYYSGPMVVNEAQNELWMALGSYLVVQDCDSLRRKRWVSLGAQGRWLAIDAARNKVYCTSNGEQGNVVDCSSYTVVRRLASNYGSGYLDSVHSRVYFDYGLGLAVLDCRTDSVVTLLPVSTLPSAANPADNVLWAYDNNDVMYVVRDNPPGVAEGRTTLDASRITPAATVVRGVLNLTPDISSLTPDIILLDVSGRRVLSLKPGPNDVASLAPGVYFICPASSAIRGASSVTKVVLAR
jgi:DNA-binding beta-propeller fold protein YncE